MRYYIDRLFSIFGIKREIVLSNKMSDRDVFQITMLIGARRKRKK